MNRLLILILLSNASFAQKSIISLNEVIEKAMNKSIPKYQAENNKTLKYWEYKTHLSNYKPQLTLQAELPAYTRSSVGIIQPDGNISFQPVYYNNSSLKLNLEQNIKSTGGTLFLNSELQRFDNFSNNTKQYNSNLLSIGFNQPLFQYNPLKWDNLIEPLKYKESEREYFEEIEKISYTTSILYFDALLSQERLNISKNNLKNTGEILELSKVKLELGEVSKNEILKLELELLKSKNLFIKAQRDFEVSKLNLKSFSNISEFQELSIPQPLFTEELPEEKLLAKAVKNRAKIISFKRKLLEAEREISKARSENGLNVTLKANLGFSNTSNSLNNLIVSPQQNQALVLSLSVPILDWGRSKAQIKTAFANKATIEKTIEQERQNFKQEVFTEITLFNLLTKQIEITVQADKIAKEKYEIAKNTYKIGNISVTELSIAFSEKYQARQDYIEILGNYWKSYYGLRMLTLYDFEKQKDFLPIKLK